MTHRWGILQRTSMEKFTFLQCGYIFKILQDLFKLFNVISVNLEPKQKNRLNYVNVWLVLRYNLRADFLQMTTFILNVQTETAAQTFASLAAVVMLTCLLDTPVWLFHVPANILQRPLDVMAEQAPGPPLLSQHDGKFVAFLDFNFCRGREQRSQRPLQHWPPPQ